jgi:tripartite-type tricarboxylate transporter receptor subunit TctC
MELIKSRSGIAAVHVPYQGNPQVITALVGGQLQAALLPPGLAVQLLQAGKLKAIGVSSAQRSALASELPTLRDVGITGADVELWSALAGPASLPAAIRDRLAAALIEVVKSQETRQRLIAVGWQPTPSTAEGLRLRMEEDTRAFGGIIRAGRIRSDG